MSELNPNHDASSQVRILLAPPFAVILVSCSGLFAFILLLLTCLCCKRGDVGFKEFENPDGEEYSGQYSPPMEETSSSQSVPDVYILPLSEVSFPVPVSAQHTDFGKLQTFSRPNLSYLQEVGSGWFGKVILGEVFSDVSPTQVVVKELRVSASLLEQRKFLAEAQPYRSLVHPNILQCLGLCTETIPYLLIMEFCQLRGGDIFLKGPNYSQIQFFPAKLSFSFCFPSDLALRNCLLTSDLTVRIGDYSLSHNNYTEDYYITPDRLWIPLRWVAPEILDDVHGNLVVVDQTKESNIWSLGVTIWELFEFGSQPYRHLSDDEVLTFVIKEQQIKLAKPRLKVPHSDYWYEVMQSCWLPASQRPTVDEVHLLLTYLLNEQAEELEDSFERRWNALKPNKTPSGSHSEELSAFPLLDSFTGEGLNVDMDDILTVTETSQGLNFEYMWEKARLGRLAVPGHPLPCPVPGNGLTVPSNPFYTASHHHSRQSLETPSVVPVISARSPSVCSEYYIRLEDHTDHGSILDYTVCAPSPVYEKDVDLDTFALGQPSKERNRCFSERSPSGSEEALFCSSQDSQQSPNVYFLSEAPEKGFRSKGSLYDGSSHLAFLDMSLNDGGGDRWKPTNTNPFIMNTTSLPIPVNPFKEPSRPIANEDLFDRFEETSLIEPVRSPLPSQVFSQVLSSIRTSSTLPDFKERKRSIFHDVLGKSYGKDSLTEEKLSAWPTGFPLTEATNPCQDTSPKNGSHLDYCLWCASDASSKTEACSCGQLRSSEQPDSEMHVKAEAETMGENIAEIEKPELEHSRTLRESSPKVRTLEDTSPKTRTVGDISSKQGIIGDDLPKLRTLGDTSPELSLTTNHTTSTQSVSSNQDIKISIYGEFYDPLMGSAVKNYDIQDYSRKNHAKASKIPAIQSLSMGGVMSECDVIVPVEIPPLSTLAEVVDEDTVEITSEVPAVFTIAHGILLPPERSQRGPLDSVDSLDIPSNTSSSDVWSPASYYSSPGQKFIDSGYDTENTFSPEFIFKEAEDSKIHEFPLTPISESTSDLTLTEDTSEIQETSDDGGGSLRALDASIPYRDSAYFSDYDTESEKQILPGQSHQGSRRGSDSVEEGERSDKEGKDLEEDSGDSCNDKDAEDTSVKDREAQSCESRTNNANAGQEAINFTANDRNNLEEKLIDKEKEKEPQSFLEQDHAISNEETHAKTSRSKTSEEPEMRKPPVRVSKHQSEKGLLVQVCKEELLYTLRENVTRKVLSTKTDMRPGFSCPVLKDQAILRPWSVALEEKEKSSSSSSSSEAESRRKRGRGKLSQEQGHMSTPAQSNMEDEATCITAKSTCNGYEPNLDRAANDLGTDKNLDEGIKEVKERDGEEDGKGDAADVLEKDRSCNLEKDMGIAQETLDSKTPPSEPSRREGQSKLFLDFGRTAEPAKENIKAKVARLSLSLPPLNLQTFSKPPGRKAFWDSSGGADDSEGDCESEPSDDEEYGSGDPRRRSEEGDGEGLAGGVPIVITETDDGRNLRSLLKSPRSMEEAEAEEMDRKRKMVSFFDDVTVYLFDQETPTNELSNQATPENERVSQDPLVGSAVETFSSGDGFSSSFEWDDDFPLMPQDSSFISMTTDKVSMTRPPIAIPTPAGKEEEEESGHADTLKFSRFIVSPASDPHLCATNTAGNNMEPLGETNES
nr:PREDICTED: serine/threonine-protein kinase LMTK2-like [Latimeria chalumnae]|eukprot:XP_014346661.1 PREDICTED: serine/threonine-protein kinase LMTK2-like [Latimeria chalumnae]